MTKESMALLSRIELMAKEVVNIAMPESHLEDVGVEIWNLCEQIQEVENRPQPMPFAPEINEMIEKTRKLGESITKSERMENMTDATKLWQQAHNQPDTLPDIDVLINWLALEIENKQYTITCAVHEIADLRELLDEARADLRLAKNIIEVHVERVAERDKLIEQMREEISRLKRCCNCEYANHKFEVCEHPDNEPETFMDGVCDLWSHNI